MRIRQWTGQEFKLGKRKEKRGINNKARTKQNDNKFFSYYLSFPPPRLLSSVSALLRLLIPLNYEWVGEAGGWRVEGGILFSSPSSSSLVK